MMKDKYTIAFMDMAERFAETSEDERMKVGALIYHPEYRSIISMGINGTPEGWHSNVCQDENNVTLPEVRHGEISALKKLQQIPLGARGTYLFVTHMPCYFCAIDIVEARIERVYYRYPYRKTDGIYHLVRNGVEVFEVTTQEIFSVENMTEGLVRIPVYDY